MDDNKKKLRELNSKSHKGLIKAICIIVSYIVIFGCFGLIEKATSNNTTVLIVFAIITCYFGYKLLRETLTDFIERLGIAGILLAILIGCLVGFFVAPYYIGNWISKQIMKTVLHETIDDFIKNGNKD